jgi:hypothetical protein
MGVYRINLSAARFGQSHPYCTPLVKWKMRGTVTGQNSASDTPWDKQKTRSRSNETTAMLGYFLWKYANSAPTMNSADGIIIAK